MAWQKKYNHMKPYKRVVCCSDVGCKLLREGYFYGVIDETETTYLIQFSTGAANWYDRNRFVGAPKPKPKPIDQPKIDELINKLF